MAIQINGNGTITGISVGGLPDGIVDTDMIAANAVATAKIADSAVTSAKASGLGGLTMVDQWRMYQDHGEANNHVLAYWEQNDSQFSNIGGSMTNNGYPNGVFTFPSTGIYKIDFFGSFKRAANQNLNAINLIIQGTTNDGSDGFPNLARGTAQMASAGDNQLTHVTCSAIFDVTNVSTHKVRVYLNAATHVRTEASSDHNKTAITFLKLGET
jgi:hypothetical protein